MHHAVTYLLLLNSSRLPMLVLIIQRLISPQPWKVSSCDIFSCGTHCFCFLLGSHLSRFLVLGCVTIQRWMLIYIYSAIMRLSVYFYHSCLPFCPRICFPPLFTAVVPSAANCSATLAHAAASSGVYLAVAPSASNLLLCRLLIFPWLL